MLGVVTDAGPSRPERRAVKRDLTGNRGRIRRLNELGFAVDEIEIVPQGVGSDVRLRVATSNRAFHAHELRRLTGLTALEGQARLLLNDLREHVAWLELSSGKRVSEEEGARRWRREVFEPTLARLRPAIGNRDPLQAYCDVLEHKWLLSEREARDVGLERAIDAYLAVGAPAPEAARLPGDPGLPGDPEPSPTSAPGE